MSAAGEGMTGGCERLESGAVELYFYDELPAASRAGMASHLAHCRECAAALDDLKVIRAALVSRPDVSAPPAGDWSSFMERLDATVLAHRVASYSKTVANPRTLEPSNLRSYIGLLATAALLAIVTVSVVYLARNRAVPGPQFAASTPFASEARSMVESTPIATTGMRSVGEQHLERSKLVVLGLASKEPGEVSVSDWAYERSLASSLLNDTRLYRLAAEERGLTSLAGVMRDLELVLLETSMAEGSDPAELPQIQRLIRKRQLIQKMDVVNTVGLVP
ncbi:hypothetical protein BH18ACI5_BH18ACI5_00370 [soil metagenome]